MASKAELEKKLRNEILEVVITALSDHFDLDPKTQIEYVETGVITIPVVDAEGNDKWPTIKVAIPRGTRNGDGTYTPYDGHAAAVAYHEEQESKVQERKVKKAMKAAEKGKKDDE
jgi:hypothetical protein